MAEPNPQGARSKENPRVETSDETLILELQRGSASAFTELFARYRDPIFGFFGRRLSDRARAEELSQETFAAVLKGIPQKSVAAAETPGPPAHLLC